MSDALASLRGSVPGGPNSLAVAAMDSLAQLGDLAALEAAEDHLAAHVFGVSYGDRDDDPPGWEPDPRMFAALARWWARLGLSAERAAWLVAGDLGDRPPRGEAAARLYWRLAPHLPELVAPLLLAELGAASPARRARIAYALGHAPTDPAIAALILLLGDPGGKVRQQAALALGSLGARGQLGAPLVALACPPALAPLLRSRSTDQLPAESLRHSYAALSRIADRSELLRCLADLAGLLVDAEPDVRRRAATQLRGAMPVFGKLSPAESELLAAMIAAGPQIDVLALLADADRATGEAALLLAGRLGESAERRAALAAQIAELLDGPHQQLAISALERLRARDLRARLRAILSSSQHPLHRRAPIILGRLGDLAAVPELEQLLAIGLYVDEALAVLDDLHEEAALPAGGPPVKYGRLALSPAELSYLARHGDSDALARVQRTEEYAFAAACAHRCFDAGQAVAAARQIEERVLRTAGLPRAQIDDPAERVRRALTSPIHASRLEDRWGGPIAHGELRARWQDLCLSLAEPDAAGATIALAAELLAGWPDELRVAHESWWLEVVRNQASSLAYSRQVIRAGPLGAPRPALALARAVSIGPELSLALDPAAAMAWLAGTHIPIIQIDPAPMARERWARAVAAAGPAVRPRIAMP